MRCKGFFFFVSVFLIFLIFLFFSKTDTVTHIFFKTDTAAHVFKHPMPYIFASGGSLVFLLLLDTSPIVLILPSRGSH